MITLHGNDAIIRRNALVRFSGSQLGRGEPAEGLYRTEDGGQAEFFMDFGCYPRLVIYTREDIEKENARSLPRHML